jgi:hypothetical protein
LLLGVGFRELHCFSSRADRSGHPVSNFFEYVLVITQFAFAIYRHHLALCSTCVSKTRYPFVTPQTCRKASDGFFPSPLLLASPSLFLYTITPVSYTFFCLGISTRYSHARLCLFASTSPIQSNFAVLNTSFAPKTPLRMYAHYAEFRYPSERARERHEFNLPRQKIRRHEYVTDGGSEVEQDVKSRRTFLSRSEGAFHISHTKLQLTHYTTPASVQHSIEITTVYDTCPDAGSPSLTSYRYLH